jgi:hypothetical protein
VNNEALAYIESLIAKADPELFECACKGSEASELLPVDIGKLFSVSNALRAALSRPTPDVPGAEEVEAIRARHESDERADTWPAAKVIHTDRATLLRLLDAALEELREIREAGADVLETKP